MYIYNQKGGRDQMSRRLLLVLVDIAEAIESSRLPSGIDRPIKSNSNLF